MVEHVHSVAPAEDAAVVAGSIPSDDGLFDTRDAPIKEAPRQGDKIGKYRLVRIIGEGGMGVVYEAVHEEIAQRAAVKMLAARLSNRPSFRQRFLREAQVSSKVRDPGLVQVFDYGTLPDGTPYILMEFVEGRPLRALMNQYGKGQLPIEITLRLVSQLAASLQVAHDAGIVHRDIKPENVMLIFDAQTGSERVKVLDFGIAKLMGTSSSAALTTRTPMGTPVYMSPEQCRGIPVLDGKSDVYSLGVLLYEMLVGRVPFVPDPLDPAGVVRRHVFDTPRPPRQSRREIPLELEQFVLRMLHKSPLLRPDMSEVARELRAILAAGSTTLGTRFAVIAVMVLVLLLLIPLLLEARYYYLHAELWRPGHRPRMTRITGARFVIGSTQDEIENIAAEIHAMGGTAPTELFYRETPERRVSVSDFYIDNYEVSNERYARWLNGRRTLQVKYDRLVYEDGVLLLDMYEKPQAGIFHSQGYFAVREELRRSPVVQVTWDGAERYCAAHGMRLPTEAEWELSARGIEGRHFPWGDGLPACFTAVFDWRSLPNLRCGTDWKRPAAAGSLPFDRTPEGVHDLGGNVAEWVLDYYREHYPRCTGESCADPVVLRPGKGFAEAGRRVVRGGSWFREFDALRGAGRSQALQSSVTSDIGFRCARPTK